jgi:hypothetical protein
MVGETQKPILPHPRSAQFRRARKNKFLSVKTNSYQYVPFKAQAVWRGRLPYFVS